MILDQILTPLGAYFAAGAAVAGIAMSLIAGRFFAPDDYAGRPYELGKNMLGHVALGAGFVVLLCAVWLRATGEFPDRGHVLVACIVGPVAFEAMQYLRFKSSAFDKAEDAALMAVMPAAIIAGDFTWAGDGMRIAGGDLSWPTVALVALPIWWRLRVQMGKTK
jgi:hypothetical protein